MMGTVPKVDYKNYNIYLQTRLPQVAIDYALTDAMILKEAFRDKAGVPTSQEIIKLGMCAYTVTPAQAEIYRSVEKTAC